MAPKPSLLHLLRDPAAERTLCLRPARAGAVTVATAKIALHAKVRLCAECVRNFQRIRAGEGQPYRPWRDDRG